MRSTLSRDGLTVPAVHSTCSNCSINVFTKWKVPSTVVPHRFKIRTRGASLIVDARLNSWRARPLSTPYANSCNSRDSEYFSLLTFKWVNIVWMIVYNRLIRVTWSSVYNWSINELIIKNTVEHGVWLVDIIIGNLFPYSSHYTIISDGRLVRDTKREK